eukprot:2561688-Prymnesium_polylepis.1
MQRIVTCAAAGRCVRKRRVCVQQARSCSGAHLAAAASLEYAESDSRTLLTLSLRASAMKATRRWNVEGASSVHCMARCRRPTSLA